jgi:3-oxoacyl-[acyl-carrier-protein] synthase-3
MPVTATGLLAQQGAPHAALLGIGAYRPSRVVPNSEVVDAIDSSDEWIRQRSGIASRRWATPEETVQVMAVAASRQALERSGIDPRQVDCVVVATVSHFLQTPALATAVAHELGTEQAAAYDVSAACAGPRSARSRLKTSTQCVRAVSRSSATRCAVLVWRPRVMAT